MQLSSPAEVAGLFVGDYILRVGDIDVRELSMGDIGLLIKKAGLQIALTIESAALSIMQTGDKITKVRDNHVFPRRMFLDEEYAAVHWKSRHLHYSKSLYRVGDVKEVRCVAAVLSQHPS